MILGEGSEINYLGGDDTKRPLFHFPSVILQDNQSKWNWKVLQFLTEYN